MVQVLAGAESFDAFPALRSAHCSPTEVLERWIAFVPQVSVAPELSAIAHAVEAARHELEAFSCYDLAATWLASGTVQTMTFALPWMESMHYGLWRAWWHWQQANYWLTTYGVPSSQKSYAFLLAESQSQQHRLEHLGEGLRRLVAWFCQEWQITVPETMQDGWPMEETSASSTAQA